MKRYKLLKDLPFAKAGEILELWSDGTMAFAYNPSLPRFNKKDVRLFPHWFEEIDDEAWAIKNLKFLGLLFSTKEEAEKHPEWLKARAVLLEDAKGFKPNWKDWDERKWCVEYNYIINCLCVIYTTRHDFGAIHFKSREDANESIKTHEKEWEIYLGVE